MNSRQEKQKILIVDDTPENIDVLMGLLNSDYKLIAARNGEKALKLAESKNPPDLILLDIMMPEMDGYEVCKRLKAQETTKEIPVIFLTAKSEVEDETKGFDLGAVDYITKPISPPVVQARVKTHLLLRSAKQFLENQNAILEEKVKERTIELVKTRDTTIFCMATVAEYRDPETGGHIQRTQKYVQALAEHLKNHSKFRDLLAPGYIELLCKSAPLHDIGKVGILDSILLKKGKLTNEEFETMKKHAIFGHDAILKSEKMLGSNSFLRVARELAYTHHEKWDGTGYPQGLKGEDIPLSGRLMAIADVYDALISKRVYKPPFPHSKAANIIVEGRARQFDPDVTGAFMKLEDAFRNIALKFEDSDEEREAMANTE